jgi:Icc protein
MLRLAHISDLHYTEAKRARITALIGIIRRSGINHLIVTGDLTEDARAENLDQVRDILAGQGYSSSDTLTVIPGNHDLFGFIYQTFSGPRAVLGRIRSARDLVKTVKTLWRFRQRLLAYNDDAYQQDLCAFRTRFAATYENCLTVGDSRCGYPFVKLLPDNVALIGVDSNRYVPRSYNILRVLGGTPNAIRTWNLTPIGQNLSGSTGYLDYATTKGALEMPEIKDRRKIVVMHHYLYPFTEAEKRSSPLFAREMQLLNRDEIADLFISHGVDLVLHGHWHIDDSYPLDGALGPRALNGGGSLSSGFNRIDVGVEGLQFIIGTKK